MATTPKTKENARLIGGLLTMALAIGLLVGMILCMRQCMLQWPQAAAPVTAPTLETKPTEAVGPTLAVNPYGPGDFAYDDGYLTCVSGNSWLGVDVSEYQGIIDWEQVAQSPVQFAMVRLGFRAWGSKGELHTDTYWLENLQGAKAAGLHVGVYFFSQAITVEEAVEEAQFVLQLLDGAQLDLPIVFDWETISANDARTNGMSRTILNACALAFCQEIAAAGYTPMVYFNQDMAKRMYDLQTIQDAGYGFWLAMYTDSMTYPYQLDMWQYTSGGTVPGIKTNVDINLYFPKE